MPIIRSASRGLATIAFLCAVITCGMPRASAADIELQTERARISVTTVANGLEHPWALAFLPDGRLLVTERPGRLRIIQNGKAGAPLRGVPAVYAQGQGGLLDVALAPDFERSSEIFFSYAEPREGGNGTTVARARLGKDALTDVTVLFRQMPAADSPAHFGSRLVFGVDGKLFVTLGERAAKELTVRAQGLDTHFGKIVRINRDGSAPPDNPFVDVPGALPEIWSYGHRNVQGAALDPATGQLWAVEHGPKGGDELNLIHAGANYGWPLVTYGTAYSGDRIGVGTERVGIEKPVHVWVPSIATTGLLIYDGAALPQWRGNVFVGGLYGMLVRLQLEDGRVVHEERLLESLNERIRDVRQSPDGRIYALTDGPQGRVLRIGPARNVQPR